MSIGVLLLVIIFVLGLCIGSFINALQYRIEHEMPIARGRSICPRCQKQLAWYDNVPVFSFIFLRGRCRQCKKPISWQYPIIELLTSITFLSITLLTPVGRAMGLGLNEITKHQLLITNQITILNVLSLSILYSIFSILMLLALHDQKTTYVLSGYVYAAMALTLVYLLTTYTGSWTVGNVGSFLLPNVVASLVAMLPFAMLYFFSKGTWMGAGDIEIAALLGLLLGWPYFLVALYFAFIVGSVWGLAKVYWRKNAGLGSEMPFAPFLIAGTAFAFLFSEQVVSLYVRIFLG